MTNTVPDEIDPAGFEARLLDCDDLLQEVVAYLRSSAQHAGPKVKLRRFRHEEPNSGWGVAYYAATAPFCEIHPKQEQGYTWVRLRGVDPGAVMAAGFEPSKQPGWFKIQAMPEAVRFVHWILQAHDSRPGATA